MYGDLSLAKRVSRWIRNSEPPMTLGSDRKCGLISATPGCRSSSRRWNDYRRERLRVDGQPVEYGFARFDAELAELRVVHAGDVGRLALLAQLEEWRRKIEQSLA